MAPFGPLPKYWHFTSTTCRQCLQLADCVEQTASTCGKQCLHTTPEFSCSAGRRSGIQCEMCIFLHIGAVRPHTGCYALRPPPPPRGGMDRIYHMSIFPGEGRSNVYMTYESFAPPPPLSAPPGSLEAPPFQASALALLARNTCPCTQVNAVSGSFLGEVSLGEVPQYWHFASTWANSVFLEQTASAPYRPSYPCAWVNGVSGPFFGKRAILSFL